jgi:Ca2+-binding RTX toxin-like protein
MEGGAGDDRYHVDSPQDRVVESEGGGTDTVVLSMVGGHVRSFALPPNVENLEGSLLADTVTGNERERWGRYRGGGGALPGVGSGLAPRGGARLASGDMLPRNGCLTGRRRPRPPLLAPNVPPHPFPHRAWLPPPLSVNNKISGSAGNDRIDGMGGHDGAGRADQRRARVFGQTTREWQRARACFLTLPCLHRPLPSFPIRRPCRRLIRPLQTPISSVETQRSEISGDLGSDHLKGGAGNVGGDWPCPA